MGPCEAISAEAREPRAPSARGRLTSPPRRPTPRGAFPGSHYPETNAAGSRTGFTLVELLVVVAIIASLAAILVPTLQSATALAEAGVCKSNIRNLQTANNLYAQANKGFYAPGAPYMVPTPGHTSDPRINNVRWFGRREHAGQPFSREGGPLSEYLPHQMVDGCPSFRRTGEGFEAGCGGFGYNNNFVGQYVKRGGDGTYFPANREWHLSGNRRDAFKSPYSTVAFTDTAFLAGLPIEYSFCESPRWPFGGSGEPRPSIHFRHLGRANVVWLDTRVTDEHMTFSNEVMSGQPYGGSPTAHDIGWFGPETNELFDLR